MESTRVKDVPANAANEDIVPLPLTKAQVAALMEYQKGKHGIICPQTFVFAPLHPAKAVSLDEIETLSVSSILGLHCPWCGYILNTIPKAFVTHDARHDLIQDLIGTLNNVFDKCDDALGTKKASYPSARRIYGVGELLTPKTKEPAKGNGAPEPRHNLNIFSRAMENRLRILEELAKAKGVVPPGTKDYWRMAPSMDELIETVVDATSEANAAARTFATTRHAQNEKLRAEVEGRIADAANALYMMYDYLVCIPDPKHTQPATAIPDARNKRPSIFTLTDSFGGMPPAGVALGLNDDWQEITKRLIGYLKNPDGKNAYVFGRDNDKYTIEVVAEPNRPENRIDTVAYLLKTPRNMPTVKERVYRYVMGSQSRNVVHGYNKEGIPTGTIVTDKDGRIIGVKK